MPVQEGARLSVYYAVVANASSNAQPDQATQRSRSARKCGILDRVVRRAECTHQLLPFDLVAKT